MTGAGSVPERAANAAANAAADAGRIAQDTFPGMPPGAMAGDACEIALSLISHTNAGKTTLARTLLGEDIGEVRDAAHVTAEAERHTLVETREGDALVLWDTPGFGDSARLAKRLAASGNPLVRLFASTWDRLSDRPFWSTQRAARNVREEADVVLYLVNASEKPQDAGYLEPEMTILEWIGKPVIALLNQTGPPRPADEEAAETARWHAALGDRAILRDVIGLDAFARCWVQEQVLLAMVARALPPAKQPGFARLEAAWRARRENQFDAAMAAIAAPIVLAAADREPVADATLKDALRDVGRAVGLPLKGEAKGRSAALDALAARLDAGIRASTDRLIAIHGLEGRAATIVTARLAAHVVAKVPVDEKKAAIVGGFVSGALTGLAADLASGGLTFGAGLVAGGVAGAVGGAGIARGVNLVRGTVGASLRWTDAFVANLVPAALLRYLAVAHYGRGRGEWSEGEHPAFWRNVVAGSIARRGGLDALAARRETAGGADAATKDWQRELAFLARDVLDVLYPRASSPEVSAGRDRNPSLPGDR